MIGRLPPSFSIIVPTYNRPRQLGHICLPALARLDYPPDLFEVIVVDDGGEAFLAGIVGEFTPTLRIQLVKQARSGPAAARNRGASVATGRFLAFTDDDCAPTSAWLSALAHRFASTPDCAIGGSTANALVDNPYSATSQLLIDYLHVHSARAPNKMRFFTSNNLAVPASLYRSIGGFNEAFSVGGEDREFSYRWTHHGLSLIHAPEALVYHWHQMSLRSFFRQHFRYGAGAFTFRKIIAQMEKVPLKLEHPFFYLGLLQYAWSQQSKPSKPTRTLLTGCSQMATCLGYLWKWSSWSRTVL